MDADNYNTSYLRPSVFICGRIRFPCAFVGPSPFIMSKVRVGILFGGKSGEHEVSLRSAASVAEALDKSKYDVVPIHITKEGHWLSAAESLKLLPSAGVSRSSSENAIQLSFDPTARQPVDVVFPVLHGTYGEDGTVQGLLEMAGLPYVGAGVLGSAAGMDKDVMKRLFRDNGLPVVEWILLLRSDLGGAREKMEQAFGYPVFVKPANLGSSVGISKAHGAKELEQALELAASFDRRIIVERAVDARELECSVLGNDKPIASLPGEIVPAGEFYDYDAKYVNEDSRLLIPAPLSPEQTAELRDFACRAFQAIDCAGMARVDCFLERGTGKIFLNELNTIPGFTSISMYPKLWEATGIPYSGLLDRLIALALERHEEKRRTKYVR
jgi:D-alanine-D-alanine ligase